MALANERKVDKGAQLSKQDKEDINSINATIDRMRSFTPADPYILTIPQDVEPRYHHSYAFQARQWRENTPFIEGEHEYTQYQTFVFHEPGKEMYMLHNSRPPDTPIARGLKGDGDAKGKERPGTGANTPNAAPKKKISLDAYKKKQSGMTPEVTPAKELGQPVKKPAAKGPIERLKVDEDVLAAVEEDDMLAPPPEENKELKRKRGEESRKEDEAESRQKPRDTPQEDAQAPPKKTKRTTPPPQAQSDSQRSKETVKATQPVKSPEKSLPLEQKTIDDVKLPPKLSPPPSAPEETSLPPKLSPISLPSLPSRLSPTLPSNIASTLTARAHYRSTSSSSDVPETKNADARLLTPPPASNGLPKKKSPRNAFRANSSSPVVRSDTEERGRPVTPAPTKMRKVESDSAEDSEEIAVSTTKKAASEKPSSLVVRLKFKKSQREAVRRILKMRPNPAKTTDSQSNPAPKSSDQRHCERRDTNAKGVAQKIGRVNSNDVVKKWENSSSPERKRSRLDDSEESEGPATKRRKDLPHELESQKDEPITPKQQADLLSPSSAQRLASPSTMRKDVLSAAMRREQSTESHVNTPAAGSQGSPPANGTTSQPVNGVTKAPSSQPSIKTPKQQAWETEQKRLETLGRELKHAATAHLKTLAAPHPPTNPSKEQQLAAIKSIESLLAYILAFTCADEAAGAADPKVNPSTKPWRTLHGFFGFVKRNCEAFPLLLGLACWLGVVFNARILELVTQVPADKSLLDSILEAQAMMRRAAIDAEAKLDIDVLQSSFPCTWEGRTKGALDISKLEPGKGFSGSYKLPLGMQTAPFRAARAGYAMLQEWIGKQDETDYELKLKL